MRKNLSKFLALFLFLTCISVKAQTVNTLTVGNASLTNSLIVTSSQNCKLFWVSCLNTSNTTCYVQIFQTNAVPANGAVPTFSYPCSAGSFLTYDFGYYGSDLTRCTICASTTASTLTLATPSFSLQAICRLP